MVCLRLGEQILLAPLQLRRQFRCLVEYPKGIFVEVIDILIGASVYLTVGVGLIFMSLAAISSRIVDVPGERQAPWGGIAHPWRHNVVNRTTFYGVEWATRGSIRFRNAFQLKLDDLCCPSHPIRLHTVP